MWEVSRNIKSDKKSLEYWSKTDLSRIVKEMSKSDKYYFDMVKEVISKYGYHSDKELDVTYPCYYEDITPIVSNIKDMVVLDERYSPETDKEEGQEKYEKILNDLSSKLSSSKYKKIDKKIKNMRKMLWWREEFRDVSTRFYYLIRIYTIKFAEYLVNKKVLSDINDVWYLKVGNLWDYIDGKLNKKDLNTIISKNKNYYNAYRNYMSENEIGSNFGEIVSDKSSIKGLGANSGEITGRARVINSFNEIDKLQPGEILVTKFTDTGWTPKFAIIKGIITEYGGILCHAAIVSREYGIPAIVSTSDVMKKIHDGDIITMNGSTGIIKITVREE
jgi:pyruvate,water dikinase